VKDTAFYFQSVVDKYSSMVIYEAAKQEAIDDGHPPEKAKKIAEKAVEDTLPPLENMTKPTFLRNGSLMSGLLLFHGYFNKLGNVLRTDFHEKAYMPLQAAKAGKIGWGLGTTTDANGIVHDNFSRSASKFAGEAFAIFFMSNVVAEWLSGRGKDKRETMTQYLSRKMIAAPFSVVPFGAPIGEHVGDKLAGIKKEGLRSQSFSFRQAPQLALLENIGKLGSQMFSPNRAPDKRVFDGLEAFLYANGLPARQWRRSAGYMWDAFSPAASQPVRVDDPLDVMSGLTYGQRPKQPANAFTLGRY
jgi:hypothetical protein